MTKRRTAGRRRRRGDTRFKKLAISVPAALARKMALEVEAGRAPSVSALISDVMTEKIERDGLDLLLDEVFGKKPITAKERRWVAKALRR